MPDAPSTLVQLEAEGFYVLPAAAFDLWDLASPWAFSERLTRSVPLMVERQVIRAVPKGRSFASTNGPAPLHNDLQLFLGRPADLQVMVCMRAADRGGESLVVDMWAVLRELERSDPALYAAVFDVPRTFSFVAGPVTSPTVGLFGDRISICHSPRDAGTDPIGRRIGEIVGSIAPHRVALRAGEVLVVDNHRALHGREAFEGDARELMRFLVWLREPRPMPSALFARASRAPMHPEVLALDPASLGDLALVLKMLAGTSPGALASRASLPEPALYAMRDAAIRGALASLLAAAGRQRGS